MLSILGKKETGPVFPANILADFAGGGSFCLIGILLALIERNRTGKGQVVDIAMAESVSYLGTFIHNMKRENFWN